VEERGGPASPALPLPRPPCSGRRDRSSTKKIAKDNNMTPDIPNDKNAKLLAALAMHTGSESVFRHWTRRIVYTEGVQDLAEQAGAYWLIDLIASWTLDPKVQTEEFVVWKLTVKPDHTALAVAEDGNGNELARQEIEYSDFPLQEISLYLTDNTLLLPSEY
jgi:hypothetical protein